MNTKITHLFTLFTALVFASAVGSRLAQAQDVISAPEQFKINLSVSPPISYLQVPPGTTRTHTVILENSGNETVIVTPSIVDFTSDGKTGRAVLSNELSFPYISFGSGEVEELAIPAKKKAQLTLYIDVPAETAEKEYPLTILFFTKNDNSQNLPIDSGLDSTNSNTSNSQVTGAIGSNLVVLFSNNANFNDLLKIKGLDTKIFVDSFSKIEFIPLAQNESLASIAASGSAKILNWRKNEIVNFEIYPDIVLGSHSRELRALRSGPSPDEPETGSFSFKPRFLLGPYQIVISLQNDQGGVSQYTKVIYAFPFSIILVAVLGTLIGLFYFRKMKKN